jgi:hypothetical protein
MEGTGILMLPDRPGHKHQLSMMQFVPSTRRIGRSFVLLHGKQFRNALGTHNVFIL